MKYSVKVGMNVRWVDAMDWCNITFNDSYRKLWTIRTDGKTAVFHFEYEKDSVLFALRWL